MVIGRREGVVARCRIHPGGDSPRRLGVNNHLRGPVEPASDRIEKEIGAVEESEIGSGPRDGPIDRVCQIAEGDANGPRRLRSDFPGLVIELSPR